MCKTGYEHQTGSTTICVGMTFETFESFGHVGSDILCLVFGVYKKQFKKSPFLSAVQRYGRTARNL